MRQEYKEQVYRKKVVERNNSRDINRELKGGAR